MDSGASVGSEEKDSRAAVSDKDVQAVWRARSGQHGVLTS